METASYGISEFLQISFKKSLTNQEIISIFKIIDISLIYLLNRFIVVFSTWKTPKAVPTLSHPSHHTSPACSKFSFAGENKKAAARPPIFRLPRKTRLAQCNPSPRKGPNRLSPHVDLVMEEACRRPRRRISTLAAPTTNYRRLF